MRCFLFLVIITLLLPSNRARADELQARGWLHLDGYTHHFSATDANENLFGLGYTGYFETRGKLARAWETDIFRDSGSHLSAYVGHSWTYRTNALNAGVTGALMYHRNFAKYDRWCLLPVALPFVELPLRKFSVRAYYIPPVRSRTDNQIALQVMVPFAR